MNISKDVCIKEEKKNSLFHPEIHTWNCGCVPIDYKFHQVKLYLVDDINVPITNKLGGGATRAETFFQLPL